MPVQGYSLPRSPEGRAAASCRGRRGTTSETSWSSSTGRIRRRGRGSAGGPRAEPGDPGRAAALFIDWQSCTDGGGQLLDPSRSQYKEFFLVVNALLDGEQVTTCPYIWVDRDFALVRGWVQGFPKKLGSVWMTRTFGLDCPGRSRAEARGRLRRHAGRERPPARGGEPSRSSGSPTPGRPQRSAARQRPALPAAGGGTPRRPGSARARAGEEPRPVDLADLGGVLRRSLSSQRRTRSTTRWRRFAWARVSASPSHTPSTTWPRCKSCQSATATGHRVDVAGVSVSTDHFVAGERVSSDARFDDISPIDQRVLGEIARERRRRRPGGSGRPQRLSGLGRARADGARAVPSPPRRPDRRQRRPAGGRRVRDMAMLLRSLKARVIPRGARNYRAYADLAVAYEERDWHSNSTWNRVQRMPSGPPR